MGDDPGLAHGVHRRHCRSVSARGHDASIRDRWAEDRVDFGDAGGVIARVARLARLVRGGSDPGDLVLYGGDRLGTAGDPGIDYDDHRPGRLVIETAW